MSEWVILWPWYCTVLLLLRLLLLELLPPPVPLLHAFTFDVIVVDRSDRVRGRTRTCRTVARQRSCCSHHRCDRWGGQCCRTGTHANRRAWVFIVNGWKLFPVGRKDYVNKIKTNKDLKSQFRTTTEGVQYSRLETATILAAYTHIISRRCR